jgi:ATP-dependent DNA helicase RecQ
MKIEQTLRNIFGFEDFLPGQEDVIRSLAGGRSALAVFPTGRGKSLCYQLTALHLPGLTLVVSPLMALMKDQVDFLRKKSIPAARLDSSLSREEHATVSSDLTSGKLKLLYVAPERFSNERFLRDLERLEISMIVIDEAHCISEWGHNFRPDYMKLAGLAGDLGIPVSLCLTATATPKVAADILDSFGIARENFIQTGLYRSNLTLRFSPSGKPLETLLQRLAERQPGAAIVYVTLQATAEDVAEKLAARGFAARPYHAGLEGDERQEVQEWFMSSDHAVVVATIAFGMGIDKGNIRSIYHYNLPKSLENYTQEIGRAGRDGKQAVCELLGSGHDLTVLENFSYGDTPDGRAVIDLTTMIIHQPDNFSVSGSELSYRYDMRPLVVNTLLTYLELEKVIASTGPFYSTYKFIPQKSSEEIFARFDRERALFLKAMFSCAIKARKWFSLDIDEVIKKTASPRKRIIAALNYLEETGDLDLQAGGVRKGYRKLRQLSAGEVAALTDRLQEKFRLQEERDIKRLRLVVDLIGHAGCQTAFLLSYFGEQPQENCGHCEFCLSGNTKGYGIQTNTACSVQLDAATRKAIEDFQAELGDHPNLVTARQQARFFCGLTSPRTSRAGLHRHTTFGILAHQPFAHVKAWLEKG